MGVEMIESLAAAYVPSMVLFGAFELGVFDALDEPLSCADLAARIGACPDGTTRLCSALAALGLVAFDGDAVAPIAEVRAALATGGSLAEVVRQHARLLLPPLARLGEAVRTGLPQHAAWPFAIAPVAAAPYAELARHPDALRTLAAAMDHGSAGVGTAIARAIDLTGARRLVDLGCGGGVVARELLAALPDLAIESIDLPAACDVARERSAAAGLGARHAIRPGDARDGVEARGVDAVLLSALLADFEPADRARILGRALACLRPGGVALISETLLDDDRRGPPKAALLSLLVLAATCGDQLSGAQLCTELAAAGFARVDVHRGAPRDLVVAYK